MFGLGATELGIILVIVVVLFGARRLPEIGSGVGKAIKNFRAGMSSKDEIDVTPSPEDPEAITDGKSSSPGGDLGETAKREQQKREQQKREA